MTDITKADVILEAGEHANWVSPSGWKKFSVCPGSAALEQQFPDSSSIHAAEGTAAHWVREQCLLTGKNVAEFIGTTVGVKESDASYVFEVLPEWERFLQPGVDRLRDAGGKLFVEQKVLLDAWVPGQFGSVDTGVVTSDLIIVDDLKFGRGVRVEAERNGQLMQYALGFWDQIARHETEATEFLLRIDQPRVPGGGSEWRCTLDDLLRFAEDEYIPAYAATLDPDAPLNPQIDACQFCRVAANAACPALHEFMFDLLGFDHHETDLKKVPEMPDIDQLSPERRSYLIQHKGMVEKWLKSIHGLQLSKAIAGEPTPGFKAVATEGNRSWRDEEEAERFFDGRIPKKELYIQKLKSPTQLEFVAGTRIWAKAQELIHRPDGPPALVPESDKRPALIPVVDLLDDLDDDLLDEETPTEDYELDELI